MNSITYTLEQKKEAAQWLIDHKGLADVWLFDAPMGAGKTTLISAICNQLGVVNHVQSPTFAIINEYITASHQVIYHFDCYRLKNEIEAFDFGIEEYLDSGNLCFIEWPEKIESLWPSHYLLIKIEIVDHQTRKLTAHHF